ncbi:aminopeptidase P family protein [Hespellia stercorisuis]|uniref:Xaa-Pro aminopeptidase n=1 Tax=Hespellia stercorisuis DSM 15480 TaxID=1121950 RepID=A0A1M6URN9_9FIRM|nr:aminopeptidase P family protein [Hespellia stercorisuis]SHK71898.1 Xaa-Pro aminopeptidase [Hespellia stercorisuis DSM 15480]
MIAERIEQLRAQMKERQIDAYMVPSADYHQSEYVGKHFKERAFITGFTGSAGTAVITMDEAGLWTDGRYFLQAGQQLQGTGVTLFKMGEEGVPTVEEYLVKKLPEHGVLGFDGRVVSAGEGRSLLEKFAGKQGEIHCDMDLVGEIWKNRPALSDKPAFLLEEKYAGESAASKLSRVREVMGEAGAGVHVLTTLDDICWLLNIRGDDIAYSPLVLCYCIVYMDRVVLYIDEQKLDDQIRAQFQKDQVEVRPYGSIYEDVRQFGAGDTLLLDPSGVNYTIYSSLAAEVKTVEQRNPSTMFKAVKNKVEVENIKAAHIKDAVAVTKFLYWLKHHIGRVPLTEMSVSDKLEEFRREQEGFIEPSFAPISAYRDHAAIVHYESTPETNVELKPEGLLLMDTGGHYYEGTTDITRTIALGKLTQEEKEHFTITLRSMLRLANTKFLYGCTGENLDVVARRPFWEVGLNYNHGTGHGVGYLMNVHEGPQNLRWRATGQPSYPLETGMTVTDEPGLYIEGSHGIRLENELTVCEAEKNEYGQFMKFEFLTYVPIDLDAVIPEKMSDRDRKMLNDYHKIVYEKISPYLTDAECFWLCEVTRKI